MPENSNNMTEDEVYRKKLESQIVLLLDELKKADPPKSTKIYKQHWTVIKQCVAKLSNREQYLVDNKEKFNDIRKATDDLTTKDDSYWKAKKELQKHNLDFYKNFDRIIADSPQGVESIGESIDESKVKQAPVTTVNSLPKDTAEIETGIFQKLKSIEAKVDSLTSQNNKKVLQLFDSERKNLNEMLSDSADKTTVSISVIDKSLKEKIGNLEYSLTNKISELVSVELKESVEVIDTLPQKLNDINDDIQSISKDLKNPQKIPNDVEIPRDEKAIVDLSRFMTDGLKQFERIARSYASKQSEFESFDKDKEKGDEALSSSLKESFDDGKRHGQIELIESILTSYPTAFETIRSIFEEGELIYSKYKVDEVVHITEDNREAFQRDIEGITGTGAFTIKKADIRDKKNDLLLGELSGRAVSEEYSSGDENSG